jgi:hypothetical protein
MAISSIQELTSDSCRPCRSTADQGTAAQSQTEGGRLLARRRGAVDSDFSVFGKCKRVFYVDPEIAHRVLDFAMAQQDLNRT